MDALYSFPIPSPCFMWEADVLQDGQCSATSGCIWMGVVIAIKPAMVHASCHRQDVWPWQKVWCLVGSARGWNRQMQILLGCSGTNPGSDVCHNVPALLVTCRRMQGRKPRGQILRWCNQHSSVSANAAVSAAWCQGCIWHICFCRAAVSFKSLLCQGLWDLHLKSSAVGCSIPRALCNHKSTICRLLW